MRICLRVFRRKLSYERLNKDRIKFAHSSSKARKMIEDGAKLEEIREFIILDA